MTEQITRWQDVPVKADGNGQWLTAHDLGLTKREALELFALAGIKRRKQRARVKRKR